MSVRTLQLSDALYAYYLQNTLREQPLLQRLRAETAKLPEAECQISPEQGQFMGLLIELMGARRTLEIGTFTGYSALSVALALPPDGRMVACDISEEWTAIGKQYWTEAGVMHKIDLRLAPADATLEALLAAGEADRYDFAFIDADKQSYDTYYELCLKLLRPGGLIALDNMFWQGKVADPAENDESVRAIRNLNLKIKYDQRVSSSLLPIGDGLHLALKRGPLGRKTGE